MLDGVSVKGERSFGQSPQDDNEAGFSVVIIGWCKEALS